MNRVLAVPLMTRVTKEEASTLRLVAERKNVTRSTFIRQAILRALKEAA